MPSDIPTTLSISNNSNKQIYLMAGDLIQGGKQDRVIAKDVILQAGAENIDLSVFCVEQHR